MAQSSRVNSYSEYIVVRREVIRTEFVVRREHAERDAPQFHDHRCGRPRPRRDHHRGNHTGGKSPSEWYKVTIPNGGKYQKSWLLAALENMCSLKFTAVQYQVSYQWVHFFLEGSAAAEALKECSGKIVDADCRKITVYVSASPPPPAPASSPKQLESPKDGRGLPPPTGAKPPTAAPSRKDSRAVAEENSLSVQLTQHLCISNNTNPAPTPSSCLVPALTPLQDNMLTAFSQQSGMNREWSQNCLQENNWDYSRAARLFSWLKAEGKIPAIAFIH